MVLLNSWEPLFNLGALLLFALPGIPVEDQNLLLDCLDKNKTMLGKIASLVDFLFCFVGF